MITFDCTNDRSQQICEGGVGRWSCIVFNPMALFSSEHDRNPEERANWLSRMLFLYVDPLGRSHFVALAVTTVNGTIYGSWRTDVIRTLSLSSLSLSPSMIVNYGRTKPLTEDDFWKIAKQDTAKRSLKRLSDLWNEQLENKHKKYYYSSNCCESPWLCLTSTFTNKASIFFPNLLCIHENGDDQDVLFSNSGGWFQ